MDYLYDLSFDGFLTAVYNSYYQDPACGIYPINHYQPSLTQASCIVETDPLRAGKVYDAIQERLSTESLTHVYYSFLSNHPNKENLILNYLRIGFKIGSRIDSYHTQPDVHSVQELSRKVSNETHRFYGLIRFSETGNFLYAALEPDHNILTLLADHFTDRLANENFIIHDKKRNIAICYNRTNWVLSEFKLNHHLPVSENEAYYQELWTQYFSRIGIETRANKKLQAQYVPQRYRKNIIEFIKSI